MRIQISFSGDCLPLYYRMGMLSIVKEALSQSDESYFKRIFESNNKMKPFGYAVYLKDFSFQDDIIKVSGFNMIVSSSDFEFMFHFHNGIQKIKTIRYKEFKWTRENVRVLNEHPISSEKVLFKTLSPLLIESKDGKPLSPTDKDYEKEFNYYSNLVVENMLNRSLHKRIKVTPLSMKKVVIKESNSKLIDSGDNSQKIYFTAYKGYLMLEGHPDDLMCLYQNGSSKSRSYGFGLLDVEMERGEVVG
ncbi:CRISPR-associated endoribonuclease Cas6 [Bacillus solimangrovi]|uniref:CRISPR-associated endoribonuclease Cas6 n=1 Tax=Bacillus solimangrovi TaxID=1305675 RepID=A0A1E5LG15_9BACI|nr:CRISPR-associated endoribonuclease Cas6 [Bacillus solimangrovi]OEH93019.1 CRISPR-associated endoribonuclease Cas6 [Bacillus solimangrovi]